MLLLGLSMGRTVVPGKLPSSAVNGEAFFVKEALDLKNGLDIPAPVKAVPGAGLSRFQGGELGLPVAQDVSLRLGKPADFADTKIDLVRYGSSGYGAASFERGL